MASCSYDPALGAAINAQWPRGVNATNDLKRAAAFFLLILPPHRHLATTVATALANEGVNRKTLGVDMRFKTTLKDPMFVFAEEPRDNGGPEVYVALDMQRLCALAGVPVPDVAMQQHQQQLEQPPQQHMQLDEASAPQPNGLAQHAANALENAPAAAAGANAQFPGVPMPHQPQDQQQDQQQQQDVQALIGPQQQEEHVGKKRKGPPPEIGSRKLQKRRVAAAAAAAVAAAGIGPPGQVSAPAAAAVLPAAFTLAAAAAPGTGSTNSSQLVEDQHLLALLPPPQQQQQPAPLAAAVGLPPGETETRRMLANLFELGSTMIKAGAPPSEVMKLLDTAAGAAGGVNLTGPGS